MLAAKTGRKKVDQSADIFGGWIEGDGGVKVIVLAPSNSEKVLQILQIPDWSGSIVASPLSTRPIRA